VAKKTPTVKPVQKKPAKKPQLKRPNINLLTSMVVLALTLGLVLFQVQQRQDLRGKAQITNCTVTAAQLQVSSQEQALFDQINAYRQQQGKDPLVWEQNLNRAAAWMSKDMITSGRIGHMDSLGRTEEQRFPACGVSNTRNYGEAVISGAPQADEILAGWKIDPPDNAVLLNANFSQGAVAMELDATGQVAYWTFTASGPPTTTPSAGPQPTGIPIVTEGPPVTLVPSPQCLGAPCPTNPAGNPVITTTAAPTQPGLLTPTQLPVPTVDSGGPPGGGGGNPAPSQPGGGGPVDPSGNPIPVDPSGNPLPLDPSGNPIYPSGTPGGGNPNPGGGNQGGIIGLFLAFLALIIQFFLSLIGQ
jgi:uncharacterized protein YkwD